ncbi:hypothetical protein LTR53_014617 [Teratosphaeriaceae sp. CCFEE 6253]|nr:hypothetical protein LTR53_014617 [Teratosphaeriaceae sp. CCFEE 6253]
MDHPRTSLLGLPREIRDQILSYLLVNNEDAPRNPHSAGRRKYRSSGCALLLNDPALRFTKVWAVNRQLRRELGEHRAMADGHAELDIQINNVLYPTWTRLPLSLRPGKPFDLDVKLRVLTTEGILPVVRLFSYPNQGFSDLFSMLSHLLRNGPRFHLPSRVAATTSKREPYRLKTLNVLVSFHDYYTPNTWSEATTEIFRRLDQFAASGIPWPYVERIRADVKYHDIKHQAHAEESREWAVDKPVGFPVELHQWKSHCNYFDHTGN